MTLDPKQAWQNSGDAHEPPEFAEIRLRADKLYRRVRRRNLIEYTACIVLVIFASRNIFVLPHILQKLGSASLVAAACYVAWQLHRRGSAVAPEMAGEVPLYAFARAQLVRQRDALRSIFWWYLLPLIPGIALILIGNGQDPGTASHVPIWVRWVALGVIVSVFVGAWWLNQVAARKLQGRIDEIDALTRED